MEATLRMNTWKIKLILTINIMIVLYMFKNIRIIHGANVLYD